MALPRREGWCPYHVSLSDFILPTLGCRLPHYKASHRKLTEASKKPQSTLQTCRVFPTNGLSSKWDAAYQQLDFEIGFT